MIVRTELDGQPVCPMCDTQVAREGQFCSEPHWNHFHTVVFEMGAPIEMTYLDMHEQPWYDDMVQLEEDKWVRHQEQG